MNKMGLSDKQIKSIAAVLIGFALLAAGFAADAIIDERMPLANNPALDYIFGWVSYALSVLVVLLVMTSMFMWEENRRDWIPVIWLSFISTLMIVYVIKFIVQRERPHELVQEIFLGIKDYSFPSAHAAAAFSAIAVLDEEYPLFKWFWFAFAVLVGLSRVYLGVHYISDVIAGALIGYIIGLVMVNLKKKYSVF